MYEFICAYCGKTMQVERKNGSQIYCSKSCAATARNLKRGKDVEPFDGECVFQPESTICGKRECDKCGWNPVVAKARLDAIMEKLNGRTV